MLNEKPEDTHTAILKRDSSSLHLFQQDNIAPLCVVIFFTSTLEYFSFAAADDIALSNKMRS